MAWTSDNLAVIGFGEAGQTFASAGAWAARAHVFDRLTDVAATRDAKVADYASAGVLGYDTADEAISRAGMILSLVTADQALAVAIDAARSIEPDVLYLDLNSVSPETKRAGARAIAATGAHYIDVAVMSPVRPAALAAPLLLSGAKAEDAAVALSALGFSNIRVVGPRIGTASSIKMIRSVMIKGIEALSAECMLAASAAGVLDEVIASLDASGLGAASSDGGWSSRADYNLDRMMVHGLRRAAEMEHVVRTLDDLGVGSDMSRGAMVRQAEIGALGLKTPPEGLVSKLDVLMTRRTKAE